MKHENVIVVDRYGNENYMVKFTPNKENPESMFKIGDKIAKAVYISKYLNADKNGVPCSIPGCDPMRRISFKNAEKKCRDKGEGWHMLTNTEWMHLYNESVKNGTIPHGNTNYGYYGKNTNESGINVNGSGATLTGTGPATWYHDHTLDGVADLCGNVWEMVTGLRLQNGEIQYIENNDAAVCDAGEDSMKWEPITVDGKKICFSVNNEKNKITIRKGTKHTGWNGIAYKDLKIKKSVMAAAGEKLREIGIVPDDYKNEDAYIWIDTELTEAIAYRGSSFLSTSYGGVASLNLGSTRTYSYYNMGFRSAYVELETGNGKTVKAAEADGKEMTE